MLFFWNRYELPALHAGLITPQIPRMAGLMERGRLANELIGEQRQPQYQAPPPIPRVPILGDDHTSATAPTAPLSSTVDFTPQSDQQSLLPPSYPGPLRTFASLQSIRSLASIQSLPSIAAERTSPNFIFQGGYIFNDSGGAGDDSEEDSYIARVTTS